MTRSEDASKFEFSAFLGAPLRQGVVTGLFTLIPVRDYPLWLRRSIVWGPLVLTGVGAAYLGANPQKTEALGETVVEPTTESKPLADLRGIARVLAPGLAIGAVMSGTMATAIWADEKIDRGLRRIGVPLPRLVMGLAVGTITGWSVAEENRRDRSQEVAIPSTDSSIKQSDVGIA